MPPLPPFGVASRTELTGRVVVDCAEGGPDALDNFGM